MKVTIFSKDNCGFCTSAIKLAEEKQVDLRVMKLGADFTMEWLHSTFPTARTFPQIIVDGESIGGYTEFKELFESWRDGTLWDNNSTEHDESDDIEEGKRMLSVADLKARTMESNK